MPNASKKEKADMLAKIAEPAADLEHLDEGVNCRGDGTHIMTTNSQIRLNLNLITLGHNGLFPAIQDHRKKNVPL